MRLRVLERSASAMAAAAAAEAAVNNDDDEVDAAEDVNTGAPPLMHFAMGFEDLSTVVDGNSTNNVSLKPFTRTFTREKILGSWSKVGFCPFTRNCVQSKEVRNELGQASKDQALEDLHESYAGSVCRADEHGPNAGIFDGRIPVATHVEREEDKEIQVQKLLATKGSFFNGALWSTCGTRIGNASVVLRAQTAQLALEANKLATQSQSKESQRHAKLLLLAQQALLKHKNAPTTMTDQD